MGGCPAGPGNSNPTPGTYSAVRSGTSIQVNWTPATDIPTADPVSGYSVVAIAPVANGEQKVVGTRTGKDAIRTTLTVDAGVDYTIEVRTIAGGKMGAAFDKTNAPTTPTDPGDTTAPTITATQGSCGGGQARLKRARCGRVLHEQHGSGGPHSIPRWASLR